MMMIEIPVDERWLAVSGADPAAATAQFRLLVAVKLFELQRMTLGQAAEMAGLSLWDFTSELGRLGVSPINLRGADLADELAGS